MRPSFVPSYQTVSPLNGESVSDLDPSPEHKALGRRRMTVGVQTLAGSLRALSTRPPLETDAERDPVCRQDAIFQLPKSRTWGPLESPRDRPEHGTTEKTVRHFM